MKFLTSIEKNVISFAYKKLTPQGMNEDIWINEWGGKILFAHGESNARGVAILMKKNLKADVTQICADPAGRKISCNLFHEEVMLSLVVVYGPNKDTPGVLHRDNLQ